MAYLDDGCLIKHPLFAEAFLTARRDFLAAASERRKGYVETSPQVTFLGPVIRKAIEGVKFIHLIRDPKRVVRSAMRRNWYHGHFMDNVRIRPLLDSAADQKWPSWSPFEKNLWLWAETNRWIKAFLADLPAGSYLTLTSEDLFGAQAETTEAFYQFLGVARPPEALIRRVLHHKLNAQSSGTFPRACNWSPHILETTRCIAGPMMREFGYSV
jgi:hypothetical protein